MGGSGMKKREENQLQKLEREGGDPGDERGCYPSQYGPSFHRRQSASCHHHLPENWSSGQSEMHSTVQYELIPAVFLGGGEWHICFAVTGRSETRFWKLLRWAWKWCASAVTGPPQCFLFYLRCQVSEVRNRALDRFLGALPAKIDDGGLPGVRPETSQRLPVSLTTATHPLPHFHSRMRRQIKWQSGFASGLYMCLGVFDRYDVSLGLFLCTQHTALRSCHTHGPREINKTLWLLDMFVPFNPI